MHKKFAKYGSLLILSFVFPCVAFAKEDQLCKPLRDFVKSVKVDQKYSIEFRTCWFCSFTDDENQDNSSSKRCTHNGYAPAKEVCDYLIDNSSAEFSGSNFVRVLHCLSPKTKLSEDIRFQNAELSFHYGSDNSGARIELSLHEDKKIGGILMRIEADGY